MNSLWYGPLPAAGTTSVSFSASVTGVTGTTALGTLAVATKLGVPLTGVSATGSVGNVGTPGGSTTVGVTGVSAIGRVGNLDTRMDDVFVIGISAQGAVGNLSTSAVFDARFAGVEALGVAGDISIVTGAANIELRGITATCTAGGFIIWDDEPGDPGNIWIEIP